ncbi:MAG: ATP-dependent DNA helicase RecG [Terriglobia bacterium]
MRLQLDSPVRFVPSVGPARAQHLAEKGIHCVEDLLYYFPFRYENRITFTPICELRPGNSTCVQAEVLTAGLVRFPRSRLRVFHLAATDKTGILYAKWFHADYLQRVFKPGQRLVLYGKVEEDPYRPGQLQLVQPQYEVLSGDTEPADSTEIGRIVPIYEAAGPISSRLFRRMIYQSLRSLDSALADPLPAELPERYGFPDRLAALWQTHFPEAHVNVTELDRFRTPAQQRLIFEEFFFLQLGLALRRRQARQAAGITFQLNDRIREAIKKILPFHPTAAQKRVLKEIAEDMQQPVPMSRLLQGDVGSGKTIVAFEAASIAIENGYQVALMAPTEILAVQHYLYARERFRATPYRLALLVSALAAAEKARVRKQLQAGETDLLVGTHALIEEEVGFHRLGLVIVDEQHRFGVLQRLKLIRKGVRPDVLVMTATPIPRTLALTLYGDLDLSVIDEMPPGRTPIETRWITDDKTAGVFDFVRRQVAAGRQAYIVYPVIDESKRELKAATQEYQRLSEKVFPDLRVALLHGRLSSEEKEGAMAAFRAGTVHVLVSTSVVEVGVDVPNATTMVIEHADRFGLAQLHQLRGRIGRGHHRSHCLLLSPENVSDIARERLETMVRTSDGFEISEIDLKLRGPGEFFGTRQHGFVGFRIGNLLRDHELLAAARREAFAWVEQPPAEEELRRLVGYLQGNWQRRYGLAQVG